MRNGRYTRGPWIVNPVNENPAIVLQLGDGGPPLTIVSSVYGPTAIEAGRNAKLIAAAPDLIETLIDLHRVIISTIIDYPDCPELVDALTDAELAIRKAGVRL